MVLVVNVVIVVSFVMCNDMLWVYFSLDLNLVYVIWNGIDIEMWYLVGFVCIGLVLVEFGVDLNWFMVVFVG